MTFALTVATNAARGAAVIDGVPGPTDRGRACWPTVFTRVGALDSTEMVDCVLVWARPGANGLYSLRSPSRQERLVPIGRPSLAWRRR
jgi:hypothetical protein